MRSYASFYRIGAESDWIFEDMEQTQINIDEKVDQPKSSRRRRRGAKRKSRDIPTNPDIREDGRVIIKNNDDFVKYYKQQRFIKDENFEVFMEYMRTPLPAAFRINTFDADQANFLRDLVQGPDFNEVVIEQAKPGDGEIRDTSSVQKSAKISALKPLSWYPGNYGWQMNVSRVDLRKIPVLQKLHRFLIAETENGFISRQEAVSMIPPLVLDVHHGHKVLDMCAAPGSKTAQLLEYLKHDIRSEKLTNESRDYEKKDLFDDGMVVANDLDNKRCYMLVHQSSRLNSPNCIIINQDASKLPRMWKSLEDGSKAELKFDRILCDVPCSGDGTARKNVDIWKKWNVQNGNNFHRMQSKILRRGLELLEVGGLLVYSTCSLNPIENEAVVASILKESKGDVVLEDVKDRVPGLVYMNGLSNWSVMGRDLEIISEPSSVPKELSTQIHPNLFPPSKEDVEKLNLDRCIRILPQMQDTGAFFIACLKRLGKKLPWEIEGNIGSSIDNVNSSESKLPIDKKRRFKGFKEDPFFFLEPSDPDWLSIQKGFGLSDNFPVGQLVHRCVSGKKRTIYLVSKRTRNFIQTNCEEPDKKDFVKIINGGMRLFSRASSEAGFRLCQDGVAEVLPYITNDLKVNINKDDLIALLKSRTVPFHVFSCPEKIRDDIKLGSFILIYQQEASTKKPLQIPLVAWRGESTVSLYVTNMYKVHLAAVVDVALDQFD